MADGKHLTPPRNETTLDVELMNLAEAVELICRQRPPCKYKDPEGYQKERISYARTFWNCAVQAGKYIQTAHKRGALDKHPGLKAIVASEDLPNVQNAIFLKAWLQWLPSLRTGQAEQNMQAAMREAASNNLDELGYMYADGIRAIAAAVKPQSNPHIGGPCDSGVPGGRARRARADSKAKKVAKVNPRRDAQPLTDYD